MHNHYLSRGMFITMFLSYVVLLQGQSPVTLGEIKKSLSCLCDCNMIVEACEGAMACESAENLTQIAKESIDRGMNKQEILASFITRYGERVLAAPTKRGFNLTAWLLPFAAIVFAGFGIVVVLRRWTSTIEDPETRSITGSSEADDSLYKEKLEEALRNLD